MSLRLRKLVAILLLLWAAADLTVPGVCLGEQQEFKDLESSVVSMHAGSGASQQGQPAGMDDECFCCSSHLLLATPATASLIFVSQAVPNPPIFLPLSISLTPPHQPPRS